MFARPRFFFGMLAACGVLLAGQVLVSFATPASSNSPCEELRAWAESYKDASPTLEDLARFDRAHRLAIFGAISPEVRSNLWREQLRRFATRPELTAEQREYVHRAAELATPDLYRGDVRAQSLYRAFWTGAAAAFTSPEHKRFWYELGSIVPSTVSRTTLVPFCDCSQIEPGAGCSPGAWCLGSPCNGWGPGCGSVGFDRCDGLCL